MSKPSKREVERAGTNAAQPVNQTLEHVGVVWKDPVWSKVIATGITALIGSIALIAVGKANALETALFAAATVCAFSLWVIFAQAPRKLVHSAESSQLSPVYRYGRQWRRAAVLVIFLAVALTGAVAVLNSGAARTSNQWRAPQIEFYGANPQTQKRVRIESKSELQTGDTILALVHALKNSSFTVILQDSNGDTRVLPLRSSSGDNSVSIPIAAGHSAYLPGLSRGWSLTGPAGTETFYVLSSQSPIEQTTLSGLLEEISIATTRGVQQVDVPVSPRDLDPLVSGIMENFVQRCRSCALTTFVAIHR
jgi:hypothetical protein